MASTVRPLGQTTKPAQEMSATANRPVKSRPAASALPSELAGLLRTDDCPACLFLDNAERSFFSWFVNENHAAASVQAQLRAGMGMCPAHSRRLVETPGPGPVLTTVVREALAGARARLHDDIPASQCPACASLSRSAGDVAHLLAEGLAHEGELWRYAEHRGVCLKHVFALAELAPPRLMTVIAQRLLKSLRGSDDPGLLTLLACTDRDAVRRARWRTGLPDTGRSPSVIAQLCGQLRVDACRSASPAALVNGAISSGGRTPARPTTRRCAPTPVSCAAPICTISLLPTLPPGGAPSTASASPPCGPWSSCSQRCPRPQRRADGDAASTPRRARRFSASSFHSTNARRAAGERQSSVRQSSSMRPSSFPEVRATYESSHGLCTHHALGVAAGTAAAQVTQRVVDARLGVLQWELEEIRRKYAWECRHEPAGPEHDAWLRGLAQVDGHVLIGAPARPDQGRTAGAGYDAREAMRPA